MLHKLPPELRLIILANCDFLSLLKLRQVSSRYRLLAEDELRTRKCLDVTTDYFGIFFDCHCTFDTHDAIYLEKLIDFVRAYMPQLSELSLRYCPAVLTLANLIQVCFIAENVVSDGRSNQRNIAI
ncbi:hypothetical protein Tcan_02416 [Toxocara canis]|uniref:F-box domain-containing protein n=1 Tax=Toxocara canis TaxID=6265 RepID=A0A0B2UP96_TOXCA|nr:hypothetical protein Tcan_02416 [Toxocara canis]